MSCYRQVMYRMLRTRIPTWTIEAMSPLLSDIRKRLTLPSPRDLGWTKHGGSRKLTPFQEGKSWEEWEAHVREKFPVRYFIHRTVPGSLKPAKRRAERVVERVRCTLQRHTEHRLELDGVDPLEDRGHHYRDPCQVMWLAGWAALLRWHAEGPVDPATFGDAAEEDGSAIKRQKQLYDEAMALYGWWTHGRQSEDVQLETLSAQYDVIKAESVASNDRQRYENAARAQGEHLLQRDRREQEMWMRLAAIREYLWT